MADAQLIGDDHREDRSAALERALRDLTPEELALVESVREPLRTLATNVVKHKRGGEVDDLLQIGLLFASMQAPTYRRDRGAKFLTVIYRQVRTLMIRAAVADYRERRQSEVANEATQPVLVNVQVGDILAETEAARVARRDEVLYALAAASILAMAQPPKNPEELLMESQEQHRLSQHVQRAMAQLSEEDRQLVQLAEMDEEGVTEAARAVGVEYEAARYRVTKALAALGKKLSGLR